jgi:hypothetical protein
MGDIPQGSPSAAVAATDVVGDDDRFFVANQRFEHDTPRYLQPRIALRA